MTNPSLVSFFRSFGPARPLYAVDWHVWISNLTDTDMWVKEGIAYVKLYGQFPVLYVFVAVALQLFFLVRWMKATPYETDAHAILRLFAPATIVAGLKRLWLYIAPKEIVSKRSFLVDLQFFVYVSVGLSGFIAKWLAILFLLDRMPTAFSYLHVDNNWLVNSIRAGMSDLGTPERMLVIFVVAFVSHDFSSYWAHRITHKSAFLWSFHKIHHYGEQINVLAGYRFHPVDAFFQFIVMGPFTAAMITLVSPLDYANFYSSYSPYMRAEGAWYWAFAVYTLFSRLVHSHFPIFFGRFFGKVLVSPAFHMVHHSKLAVDRNFGGSFAFWDYVFGTHHDVSSLKEYNEHARNLGVRGIPDDGYPSIVQAILMPFKDAYEIVKGKLLRRPKPDDFMPSFN